MLAYELQRSMNSFAVLEDFLDPKEGAFDLPKWIKGFQQSDAMRLCLDRFKSRDTSALLNEALTPFEFPETDFLKRCPSHSLGFLLYKLLAGGKYLKGTTFTPMEVSNEEEWLHQRLAYTHDIHHILCGFSTNPSGEMGVMAVTATQIGYPPFIFTTLTAMAKSYRLKPSAYESYNRAIAIGSNIGMNATCLASRDWSSDFAEDITVLRHKLGISPCDPNEAAGISWNEKLFDTMI